MYSCLSLALNANGIENMYLKLEVSENRRKDWSLDNCTPLGKAKPSITTCVFLVGGSYLRSLPLASPSDSIREMFLSQIKKIKINESNYIKMMCNESNEMCRYKFSTYCPCGISVHHE